MNNDKLHPEVEALIRRLHRLPMDACIMEIIVPEVRAIALLAAEEAHAKDDAAFREIEAALLPDPHDEREVSIDWLRKTIRAVIRRRGQE